MAANDWRIDDSMRVAVRQLSWNGHVDNVDLDFWFDRYEMHLRSLSHLFVDHSAPARTSHDIFIIRKLHQHMLMILEILNEHPGRTKKDFEHQIATAGNSAWTTKTPLSLDLCLRLFFMTACRSSDTPQFVVTGRVFRPKWNASESIEAFFQRCFPQTPAHLDRATDRISPRKLSASFLRNHANIQIEWTDHLPDHLLLETHDECKILHLFRHPGFLKMCMDDSTRSAASKALHRCFPKAFAAETLRSYELLFPESDGRAAVILAKAIKAHEADPQLQRSYLYDNEHESPLEALQPGDVRRLYQKFPYWGDRIYCLWLDADDPAPVSKLGWWSEGKKSPRFVYWAGVIALSIAVFFGVVASVLSAVQVWLTYCAWKNDPDTMGCRVLGTPMKSPR